MLAANLPVCQYAGMPGQSNNNSTAGSNHNSNTSTNNNNASSSNLSSNSSGNQNTSNCHNNNNSNSISNSANHSSSSNNNNNNTCPVGNGGNANTHIGLVGGGTSAAAAKNQLEQLNTMREALFSQDGWGCQHVNQDTNWEVPSSPEPTNKDPSGPPLWKPTINNGTDLWESNLRNGGQPTSQPVQKTPWGHTPSTNLGGTWGEDDDGPETSNVWTGGPGNASVNSVVSVGVPGVTSNAGGPTNGSQWGQGTVSVAASGQGAIAAPGNIPNVASGGNANALGVSVPGTTSIAAGSAAGNGWGDLRGGPMGGPLDMRSVDPRDPMRATSAGDPRDLRMLDPRDPIRGDPRGISGRLNGTSEMWGQHHPITHNQITNLNKMVGPTVGGSSGVGAAVVAGAGGIGGPGVGAINPPSGVTTNVVGSQWGTPQSVVGPKDLTAITSKPPPGTGWEEPSPPPQRRNLPNYDDGTSLWGQQSRVPGGGSHWKDVSDPRSHIIRTTIGGQNPTNANVVSGLGGGSGGGNNTSNIAPSVVAAVNPNNPMGVSLGPPGRLVAGVGGPGSVGVNINSNQHKPENTIWTHPGGPNVASGVVRNTSGAWADDNNHNVVGSAANTSNWSDDKSNPPGGGIGQIGGANVSNSTAWNDQPTGSWSKANPTKLPGASGWGVTTPSVTGANDANDLNPADWSSAAHNSIMGKSQQQKINPVSIAGMNNELKQSKQFRILVDAGFKKEDVERALINTNMNIEEATEILRANMSIGIDNWRRHDDSLGSYADHGNAGNASFPGRYAAQGTQPTMSFPPQSNLLNNMGGTAIGAGSNNPNLNALNSMQPLQVQKYLTQSPHSLAGGPQSVNASAVAFGQGANVAAVNAAVSNSTNQPSTQQLRMLVQQIQLAVHNGYLSSQILNQPLAPATLLLLNQLLSNIKHLQGAQQSLRGGNNANTLVAIAKYKQQIQSLQNQINAQQAIYIKQQQQQQALQQTQHPPAHINNTSTEYLRGHDAINALQGNFSEMSLSKSASYQPAPNPQSRLNQWKLPALEKDITVDSTDFSRAPGATKQNLPTNNANNMGPLGLQGDGTWSTGRSINDGWPDPTNDSENKDWSVGQSSTAAATYTDLVQEFEPGKPWKGPQIKSIEDDPSITPGSVARSPLSINPTPKDADLFANASKNSPTDLPSLGLTTSSTWSFNPSTSNQNFPSWSDNSQPELWTSMNKSSRGPPPGLAASKSAVVSGVPTVSNPSSVIGGNSNGWLGGRGAGGWSGTNSSWNSNWLLLKNLTAQIDSSTLRTLCMQHGPLLRFHLYLNQGIALCKYATREEASKAQMTLNNCFLGNTTICAESPSESEVDSILHHLPQSNSGVTSSGGNGGNGGGGNNGGNNVVNVGTSGGNSSSTGSSGNNCVTTAAVNGVNGAASVGSNNPNNVTQTAVGSGNVGGTGSSCGPGQSSAGHNSNPNNPGQNNTGAGTNANSSAWRQQVQNATNQNRPTGRDDFEFISQYVCSIVDD
uniref:UBA domain-containing protein n=1 Tax=Glossina austeni TaxID=7395 RepID=A0A1A9V7V6_GLOAU